MNPLVVLSTSDRAHLRSGLIQQGLYYCVPSHKADAYKGRAIVKDGGFVDLLECKGVYSVSANWQKIQNGISHYLVGNEFLLRSMESWLPTAFSHSMLQALEYYSYYANNVGAYISDHTLIRLDLVVDSVGNLRCCDTNLVPLGYAFLAGYTRGLRTEGIQIRNNYQFYSESFRVASKVLASGIVTSVAYPNWPSHRYTAGLIRSVCEVPFFTIPLESVVNGVVSSKKLHEFHQLLGISAADIPVADFTPHTLVRYAREAELSSEFTVNNAGIRLLESHLMMVFPWLNGYASTMGLSDMECKCIQDTLVPSLLIRLVDGSYQLGTSVHLDDGTMHIVWKPFDSPESITVISKVMHAVGATANTKRRWFVKRASSTGFKGVHAINETRFDRLPLVLDKIVPSFLLSPTDVFLLQPAISSTVDMAGESRRVKLGLYLCGKNLSLCGADIMSTSTSSIAVHGGSGTDYWIVDM